VGVIFYTFCIYLSFYYDFIILKKIANLQEANSLLYMKQHLLSVEYHKMLNTEIIPQIKILREFDVRSYFHYLKILNYFFYPLTTFIPLIFSFIAQKKLNFSVENIDKINIVLKLLPKVVTLKEKTAVTAYLATLKVIEKTLLVYEDDIYPTDRINLNKSKDRLKSLLEHVQTLTKEYNSNKDLMSTNKMEIIELMELTQVTSYIFLSYSF